MTVKTITRKVYEKRLIVSLTIFILFFILTRLPYYFYINIAYIFDDASSYIHMVGRLIKTGQLLTFEARGPVYPLFAWFSSFFSSSITGFILLQSITTILCVLLFIVVVNKYYPKATILTAITLTVFTTSVVHIHHETAILSENIGVNLYLLFAASVILSFKSSKKFTWLFPGIFIMLSMFARPISLFMFASLGVIFLYMLINKFNKYALIYLWVPVVFFYILLATYNYNTINDFTIKESHGKDFLGFLHPTLTYLETNEKYSEKTNELIQKAKEKINPQDIAVLNKSWDIYQLRYTYIRNKTIFEDLRDSLHKHNLFDEKKQIATDAIKKHPEKYFKWVYTMFFHYFASLDNEKRVTYPFFENYEKCFNARTRRYFYDKANKTGYFCGFDVPTLSPQEADKTLEDIDKQALNKFNQSYSLFYNKFLDGMIWVVFLFITLFYSLYLLIIKRFKHTDAFISLIILSLSVIAAMSYALVHGTFIRYSYPLSFTYYLALAFLYILLKDSLLMKKVNAFIKKRTNKPFPSKETTSKQKNKVKTKRKKK